jgi:hypothetical protein
MLGVRAIFGSKRLPELFSVQNSVRPDRARAEGESLYFGFVLAAFEMAAIWLEHPESNSLCTRAFSRVQIWR